jgi:hypothetical protein
MTDNINQRVFPLSSNPFGSSYKRYSIAFWKWLASIPADKNPVTDQTGERCGVGQVGHLLFNLVFSDIGGAERACTLRAGQHLLIPVNVAFFSKAEFPDADDAELERLAKEDESSNPDLFLSVDGIEFSELRPTAGESLGDLEGFRVPSGPFDVIISADHPFGVEPGPTRAVSDGYWVILEPLEPGAHTIEFGGTLTNKAGTLFYSERVKYTITVREDQTKLRKLR